MTGVVVTADDPIFEGFSVVRRARRTGIEAAMIVTAASAIPRMLRGTVWTGTVLEDFV